MLKTSLVPENVLISDIPDEDFKVVLLNNSSYRYKYHEASYLVVISTKISGNSIFNIK
jgi:hypothetical protein